MNRSELDAALEHVLDNTDFKVLQANELAGGLIQIQAQRAVDYSWIRWVYKRAPRPETRRKWSTHMGLRRPK